MKKVFMKVKDYSPEEVGKAIIAYLREEILEVLEKEKDQKLVKIIMFLEKDDDMDCNCDHGIAGLE